MEEDHRAPERTSIPTISDKEDTFIPLGEFSISLRQIITVALGGVIFILVVKFTSMIFPLTGKAASLIWSPIIIVALCLAFIPKNGAPLEVYLSEKLEFWLSDKDYVLMDDDEDDFNFEDADWDEIEESRWR